MTHSRAQENSGSGIDPHENGDSHSAVHLAAAKARLAGERFNAISDAPEDPLGTRVKLTSGDAHSVQVNGPLENVPITVKDSFHVAGLRRWHGSAVHPGAVSTIDSAPIQRLTEAGAVVVAKTTMPDFGLLASGVSSQFGITRNPWDPATSTGGSSAGAGAALAAGVTRMGLGTDIAGSVRLPAAQCGVVGFKPTQGTIPYAPASTWRSAGPMARTVAEVQTLYTVLSQSDPSDQLEFAYNDAVATAPLDTVRGLRVGLLPWTGYGPRMDDETAAVFDATVSLLEREGAQVSLVRPSVDEGDFEHLDRIFMTRAIAEIEGAEQEARDQVLPVIQEWLQPGRSLTAADFFTSFEHLSALGARLLAEWAPFDLLVSPVMGSHTFPAEQFGPDTSAPLLWHSNFTAWFNQSGQPAIALPAGTSASGLPIGIQLAGRRRDDHRLLAIATVVEQLLDLRLAYPELDI